MGLAIAIGRAAAADLDQTNAFYDSVGYADRARPNNRLWLAREGDAVVAAVRICPQPEGYVLMRGLYVLQSRQRQGVGSQLARAALADVAGRVCYCIPFAHLEAFYRRLKFARIRPEHGPQKLADRLRRYLDDGLDVILMRRSPVYDC